MMSMFSIQQYKERAQQLLPQTAWDSCNYTRERGLCYNDSINAFARYRVRSRLLQDVSRRSLATTVLGQPVPFPIGIAPTANHAFYHPDKEKETARGAFSADALLVLSANANTSMADVAAAAPAGLRWMQVYPFRDRQLTECLIREAERCGYKAMVVTVDSPVPGVSGKCWDAFSEVDTRTSKICPVNCFMDTPSYRAAKAASTSDFAYVATTQFNPTTTWDYIRWMKSITSLPIVCKGILTGESASEAADAGVDGILVSAHGGRQMDGSPAPIDALAEVVQAVQGRGVEVYMDGGVRTGTDVFMALGRGARMVFVGRPILWGLTCQGAYGVCNVLNILKDELDSVLANSGCTSPTDIPKGTVVHASYYNRERLHSKL